LINIRKTIDVQGCPEHVFEFLVKPTNIVEYVGPIRRLHGMNRPAVTAGTELTVTVAFLGVHFEQRAACTLHQPPVRFECCSIGGPFTFRAGFVLQALPDGTQLRGWGDASAPALFRLAEPVLGVLIERQVERDLGRLRRMLDLPA
jgi:ligand-binding SRPBCC domain-containing protein